MSVRSHRGAHGIQFRNQNAKQEWAVQADCAELIHQSQVAAQVDARTSGTCYWPDCEGRIISYPHAVPVWEHGVHHAINRAGVCTIHGDAMHHGRDPTHELRLVLQEWLQNWYVERGLTPEKWMAMATGITPVAAQSEDRGEVESNAMG